jgi:hypothetical protein
MKRLIALSGRAGSGKDTVASMIPGAVRMSFAEPLKRFCMEVFGWTEAQVFGPSELRNVPDPRYVRHTGELLTPRHALQTLGTEWGRGCSEDVWAQLGVRRALASPADVVVITDCRFVNEARAVRSVGGEVWRVVRPGAGLVGAAGLHASEAEQESPEFLALVTRTIENGGTLSDLLESVIGSGI